MDASWGGSSGCSASFVLGADLGHTRVAWLNSLQNLTDYKRQIYVTQGSHQGSCCCEALWGRSSGGELGRLKRLLGELGVGGGFGSHKGHMVEFLVEFNRLRAPE